jgi:hypothetical protein
MPDHLDALRAIRAREAKPATCPRCQRGTLVYQEWSVSDVVAICRHVHKCGLRVVVPFGRAATPRMRNTYVFGHWRSDGY